MSLFRNVDDAVLLGALADCSVIEPAERQVLLERDAPNHRVFILLAGSMTLDLGDDAAPHPVPLAPGQSVGELSITDGSLVSARVTAEPGSRILVIDEEAFWRRLMVIPGIVRNLMTIQAERIRRSNDLVVEKLRGEMAYAQLRRDLAMSAEIQRSMLPSRFPLFPGRIEFDLYATMLPARDVGGDFYDAFLVDAGHLFFIVGDVSGKGVSAALFMARAMTLFRIEASQKIAPHLILQRVNEVLAENNERCMFVTVSCGILDVQSGDLSYSNAGHCPPLLGRGGRFRWLDVPPGPAIGLVEEARYASAAARLQEGDLLLLYTDGVTEAADPANGEYSEERLLAEAEGLQAANPREAVDGLMQSIYAFARGAEQSDDITLLALQVNPR